MKKGTFVDMVAPRNEYLPRPWTDEEVVLITWYRMARLKKLLPQEPFRITDYAEIVDYPTFYGWLDACVREERAESCYSISGTTTVYLKALKGYVDAKAKKRNLQDIRPQAKVPRKVKGVRLFD